MAKVIDLENRLNAVTSETINNEIELNENKVYDNKVSVAKEAIKSLCSNEKRTNHVILAASMQSGKTAVMNCICNILLLSKLYVDMGIKKFIFATGMNDVKLKKQTVERAFGQIIGANEENMCFDMSKQTKNSKFYFLKNSDLPKAKVSLRNAILLLDEVQYGTNEKNNLTKFLTNNKIDWKDKQSLSSNNTYIVSVSATPFNEMVSDTLDVKKIINIKKDDNYVGISEFLSNDSILDATRDDILNGSIFRYIEEAYERMKIETRGCGIIFIRTREFPLIKHNSYVEEHFDVIELSANGSNIDYSLINDPIDKLITRYDYFTNKGNKRMKYRPILVLIKGAFRAGVTIPTRHKDFTYMVYDFSVNPETTAQALLGRMCGYRNLETGYWKRTIFYVNKKLAEQYSRWESDYSNKSNIPSSKEEYSWVDKDYKGGITEVCDKPIQNLAIDLSDSEVMDFFNKDSKRSSDSLCRRIKPIYDNFLKERGLEKEGSYDYICEVYLSGKNNYARSTQTRRFESFKDNVVINKFRPEKCKEFVNKNGRDTLTIDDIGTKIVSLALDANIIENDNGTYTISGNKRLLVYRTELSLRTRVPNRKDMFKIHKCTDLKRVEEEKKK